MNLHDPFLKRYVLLPSAMVAAIVLVYGLGSYLLEAQKTQLESQSRNEIAELNNLMRQVQFLRSQEQLFLTYGDKYQALTNEGGGGGEDRVKWADKLLKIQDELTLQPFAFQFEPEQKLTKKDLTRLKLDKDIFYFTRLNITAGLQSDLDMLRIFDRIQSNITPLFFINNCKIETTLPFLEAPAFKASEGRIRMECTIVSFEAKPNSFKGIK